MTMSASYYVVLFLFIGIGILSGSGSGSGGGGVVLVDAKPKPKSNKVPSIIVFGDSSVDTGNNNHIFTILRSNFKPYGRSFEGKKATGRFSDGKMPTDYISEAFGLKNSVPAYLDPDYNIADFATGVCFASAGTGYDNATSDIFSVISLRKELEMYKEYQKKLKDHLGDSKANEVISESLYLISSGTNDFLENYFLIPRRSLRYTIEEYQNFLIELAENFIKELYQLGARKISITGLPPMGCLPLKRVLKSFNGGKPGCVDKYNTVARDFNDKLKVSVAKLNHQLNGIRLVFANPYDILSRMINDPNSFGFSNTARGCCGTGYFEISYLCNKVNPFTCSDANKHVFWDAFHLTEKANCIVAKHIIDTSLHQFL